jgi:DNA polymerase-3 subunit epsilon
MLQAVPEGGTMKYLAFDIEATGLDPFKDRIIELAIVRAQDGLVLFNERMNPGMHIPPRSTRIHGLTNADVWHCERFSFYARQLQELIGDAVLVGFGSRRFDTLMLDTELRRAGESGIDLAHAREIDLNRVWVASEPRSLGAAVDRFLGHGHDEAHRALADAEVLPALLRAMGQRFGHSFEDLVAMSRLPDEVDRSGRLRFDRASDQVVFAFGQYRGEPIGDHEPYLDWMLTSDFPPDTKAAIRALQLADYEWRPPVTDVARAAPIA